MEKEFCTYNQALKLKALGFNEQCFGRWWFRADMHNLNEEELEIIRSNYFELPEYCILAPTFSQAFLFVMQFPQIKKYRYNVALYSDGTYSLKEGKYALYEYLSAESCIERLIEKVESKSK